MNHSPNPITPQQQLNGQLDQCMLADRHRLTRRIHQVFKSSDQSAIEKLAGQIQASIDKAEQRRHSLPPITLPDDLPITDHADELISAITNHQVVIVAGETGSGKSTQLPKLCLQAGRGVFGQIGHTQPRRVAARSIANRLSSEMNCEPGQQIGYKVRFSDQTSPNSLIKVMTDGMLLAETRSDRFLSRYDTIIIDEAHERSLNIDFLLGILKRLLKQRPELKLIITSATIDTGEFSRFFSDAPIFQVSGRGYPVEISYQPLFNPEKSPDSQDNKQSDKRARQSDDLNQGILNATHHLMDQGPGDILAFLPGEREIVDAQTYIEGRLKQRLEIVPLYSRLSQSEQDRIFKQRNQRRLILSTNIAETSLTVPGIHYVIDAGLARISRYSARSKIQQLPIEKISQAAANQRAGRCGRIAPGICVRLFSEDDFDNRPPQTEPEIVRTNLSTVILQMLNLKLGDPLEFPFIDPPQSRLINDGYQTLVEIGAINADKTLTEIGRHLAQLPLDPRLGRMLLAAKETGCLQEVIVITAGLTLQDPRERPREFQQQADQKHRLFAHPDSDFLSLLNLWQAWREQSKALSGSKLRRWCRDHFLNFMRMREWQDLQRQLSDYARQQKWSFSGPKLDIVEGKSQKTQTKNQPKNHPDKNNQKATQDLKSEQAVYARIHQALLAGLLSNIARQVENKNYTGARSSQVSLFPGSNIYKKPPNWIVAAELVETSQLFARTAAKIDRNWIEPLAESLVRRNYSEPHWAASRSDVYAFEKVTLFGLQIVDRRRVRYSDIDPVEARRLFIRDGLVGDEFQQKYDFLKHNRELVEEIEALQIRIRRHDLIADDEPRIEFFEQLIPAEVCNGYQFKIWFRQQVKQQPDLLCYPRELILERSPSDDADRLYPNQLQQPGIELPLDYQFEPINETDGATLTIRLALLNQLDTVACDYVIPGLLKEKIETLLRQLPKPLRKQLVPLPDRATEILLEPAESGETVIEYLRRRVQTLTRLEIPVGALSNETLPAHLRMHLKLIDDDGQVIDQHDNAGELQQKWQSQAQQAFGDVQQQIERNDITEWDFGDLPEWVEQQSAGQAIRGYPGLEITGTKAALKVFDNPKKAQLAHQQGCSWLLARSLRKRHPGILPTRHDLTELAKNSSDLGTTQELVNDLTQRILSQVYPLDPAPTTEQQFNDLLAQPTDQLITTNQTWMKLLTTLISNRQRLNKSLRKLPIQLLDTGQQIQRQLGQLIYNGFLTSTPGQWLPHLPRYLEAMQVRLQRADQDPQRERKLRTQLLPLLNRWDNCPALLKEHPDWIEYRWCLEELRVALFAQPLKTHRSVSIEKMEKIARGLPRE